MTQTTTASKTFKTTSDLVSDINNHKYTHFACESSKEHTDTPRKFKSDNIKQGRGIFSDVLIFERGFSNPVCCSTGIESVNKLVDTDKATYTIFLRNGIDLNGNMHNSETITVYAFFDCNTESTSSSLCALTDEQICDKNTYNDPILIDKSLSHSEEYDDLFVGVDVLDLRKLGTMNSEQKETMRDFMVRICDCYRNENKTLCWITAFDGSRHLGVYGLDSQKILGMMGD